MVEVGSECEAGCLGVDVKCDIVDGKDVAEIGMMLCSFCIEI